MIDHTGRNLYLILNLRLFNTKVYLRNMCEIEF
jgi:hypothetical protein